MPDETETTEIKFEKKIKVHDLEEPVSCINGHSFLAKNCKMLPFTGKDLIGEIMFIDGDLALKTGFTVEPVYGFLMACPVCGLVHLSGFEPPLPDAVLFPGAENFVEDRNFSL